ncbi:MAG: hypothetical protein AB3N63_17135 [Puniceicoccaceae bacterium]
MKKTIITISLILSLAISSFAGTAKSESNTTAQFARAIVHHFGDDSLSLNEVQLADVLEYLNANIPQRTPTTNLSTRMSRNYNLENGASGDNGLIRLHEINAELEQTAEAVIARFDKNGDKEICDVELAAAFEASGINVSRG